jgi:hypothetical protein
LLVPSVAHGSCSRLMMTGTTNDGAADWAAVIAGESRMGLALPQVVLESTVPPSPAPEPPANSTRCCRERCWIGAIR